MEELSPRNSEKMVMCILSSNGSIQVSHILFFFEQTRRVDTLCFTLLRLLSPFLERTVMALLATWSISWEKEGRKRERRDGGGRSRNTSLAWISTVLILYQSTQT